jgi:L-asparaginase
MANTPFPGSRHWLLLTTGGTIAGQAASALDNVGYRSGTLGAAELLRAVPALQDALGDAHLQSEALAAIDSKDLSHGLWQALVRRLAAALSQPDLGGVVITHGTDTLEETAYFLHRVLAPTKPVVLTAAMRPASSLQADGPQNLLDAFTVACTPGARGVLLAFGGRVFGAEGLRKADAYRLDAFDAGPAGPVALVEEGRVQLLRPWPDGLALGAQLVDQPLARWPRVAWITSHAGFDGALVDAAVAAGFEGLLLAGTGNGTLHADLLAAARRAVQAGVAVRVCTRCASGRVVGHQGRELPLSEAGSPAQARVGLLLELLATRAS